jgi:hypothetical protein
MESLQPFTMIGFAFLKIIVKEVVRWIGRVLELKNVEVCEGFAKFVEQVEGISHLDCGQPSSLEGDEVGNDAKLGKILDFGYVGNCADFIFVKAGKLIFAFMDGLTPFDQHKIVNLGNKSFWGHFDTLQMD